MTGARSLVLFAAAMAACGLAAVPRVAPAPWLINETGSLPRGFYVRTPVAPTPGTVVALKPPAVAKPYLSALGAPADARLLKHVVAGPGESVCHDGGRMTWARGVVIAAASDRRGRPLPAWRGCRRLRADELLVVGESPASFDSRYFGPVRRAAIEGVYREVWTW